MDIIPEKPTVTASVRGSGELQWNIIKENDTNKLFNANLILIRDGNPTLYSLNAQIQQPLVVNAKTIFGDRIEADIRDGNIYVVTLTNLNYNDSASFKLEVQTREKVSSGPTSAVKEAVIQLIVQGKGQTMIFCSCS